jgi:hypothetical protein
VRGRLVPVTKASVAAASSAVHSSASAASSAVHSSASAAPPLTHPTAAVASFKCCCGATFPTKDNLKRHHNGRGKRVRSHDCTSDLCSSLYSL